MHFMSVDFPAPDLPVRPTISPSSMSNDTLSSARIVLPSRMWRVKSLCRSSTSRMVDISSGSSLQKGTDQQLGVGMLRVLENLIGQAALDDVTVFEDDGAVGEHANHAEIV